MRTWMLLAALAGAVPVPATAPIVQTKSAFASCVVVVNGAQRSGGMVGDVIAGRSDAGPTRVWHGFFAGTGGSATGVSTSFAGGVNVLSRPVPTLATERTTLYFRLAAPQAALRLEIFDVSGRRVASLVQGPLSAGDHARTWDLRNSGGTRVGAGVYFACLTAGTVRSAQRVVVLR